MLPGHIDQLKLSHTCLNTYCMLYKDRASLKLHPFCLLTQRLCYIEKFNMFFLSKIGS